MTFFCRIWYLHNADCEKQIPINEWDGAAMQSNTDHRKVALTQTGMATQFTATASCAMNHLLHRTENSLSFFSALINNTGGLCLVCKPAGIQKKTKQHEAWGQRHSQDKQTCLYTPHSAGDDRTCWLQVWERKVQTKPNNLDNVCQHIYSHSHSLNRQIFLWANNAITILAISS